MQFKFFTLALLSSAAFASNVEKRQSPDELNALVSQYIPGTMLPGLIGALQSAVGPSGNPIDFIQSALQATTPPALLSALPTQYLPAISSLESAIAALRLGASSAGAIPTGSVGGGSSNSTSANSSGAHATTTSPKSTASAPSSASSAGASSAAAVAGSVAPGAVGILGLVGLILAL